MLENKRDLSFIREMKDIYVGKQERFVLHKR